MEEVEKKSMDENWKENEEEIKKQVYLQGEKEEAMDRRIDGWPTSTPKLLPSSLIKDVIKSPFVLRKPGCFFLALKDSSKNKGADLHERCGGVVKKKPEYCYCHLQLKQFILALFRFLAMFLNQFGEYFYDEILL